MTARGTDWGLALTVGLLFTTGVLTLFSGAPANAWVFAVHGAGGFVLGALLGWKLRRVWRRLADPARWDRRTGAALAALLLVGSTLGSGWGWASGLDISIGGYSLLGWHFVLGALLAATVLAHALARAKPIRRSDLAGRRQFLLTGAMAGGAYALWWAQRPLSGVLGLPGARRRFTGSYEAASFQGNDFPTTSWVSDRPRDIGDAAYRLRVEGLVRTPLELTAAALDAGDELVATLDCTGGFYSRQRWRGIRLGRLLERARPRSEATHVRVISHTGYRWSFGIGDAHDLLLATAVGGEPLSSGHGAPARLVAPGRRGFEWVKWVVRIELHDGPDAGALPSTVWSSFTAEGRGGA